MSSGEILQLYSTLQEISVLLNNITIKVETLRAEAGHARGDLREVEYIIYRVTSLLRRMGLPAEIDQAIDKVQKLIFAVRVLHTTIILLESTSNFGFILGIISGIGAIVTMGSMVEGY
jgi:hypothetical protein